MSDAERSRSGKVLRAYTKPPESESNSATVLVSGKPVVLNTAVDHKPGLLQKKNT